MIDPRLMISASAMMLALGAGAGCAAQAESTDGTSEDAIRGPQLSDAAVKGKLAGILAGVTFISESDGSYVVLEGDVASEKRLTTGVVRSKLAAAVKAASTRHRDIDASPKCRAVRLDVSAKIAEGDATTVPANDDEDYVYAHHDKQLAIALKTMRKELSGVVGFTFGTNASGDQDEQGPVLYVYAGISRTTGRVIAIMTEAVYT